MANEVVVNGIKLTDAGPLIKRDSASAISIRNTGDTDYVDFTAGVITGDTLVANDLLKIVTKPTVTSADDFDLLGRINTGASDGNVVSVTLGSGLSINESGELVASNDVTVEANGTPLTNRTTYNVLNGLTAVDDGSSKTLFKLGGTLTDSNTQISTNSLGTIFGIRLGQPAVTNNVGISLGAAALPNNTGVTVEALDPTNSTFGTFQIFSHGVVRFSNHTNTFFGLDAGGLFIQLDLGSDSTGDVYYRDSGYLQRLGIGSEGQVLTVSSGLPSWQDPTGGGGGSVSAEDIQDIVGAFITDSSTIDFTYNDAGNTMSASIVSNSIGNSQFRQAGPFSVIGNPTNVTSNIQDISASSDNQILRRVSNTLGFGTISATSGAFTMSTDRLLGRTTASTGSVELIHVTNGLTLVHPVSLQLGGTLTTNTTITVPSSVSFSVSTASPASSIQVARTVTQSYLKFINTSSTTNTFTISLDIDGASGSAGAIITDTRSSPRGLQYAANYGTTFTARSLADVDYVDSILWEDVTDTTYTFLESDKTKVKRFTNPSGCLVTIPAGLSVGWNVIIQRGYGAGQVTLITAQTLEAPATTIDFEGGFVTIFRRATNIYVASGALGPASGGGGGGNGTVTSVNNSNITGLATATGGPVTGSGTLGYTLDNQSANTIFAGPESGSASAPSFRLMSMLDIPRPAKIVATSTYTIVDSDLGHNIYFTNSTGCVVTLDDAITVSNFWCLAIKDKAMTAGTVKFVTSGTAIFNTVDGETEIIADNGVVSLEYKGSGDWYGWGTLGLGGVAHVIKNAGVILPDRPNLNFFNGLTASDLNPDTNVGLGGSLVADTTINADSHDFKITAIDEFLIQRSGNNRIEMSASGAIHLHTGGDTPSSITLHPTNGIIVTAKGAGFGSGSMVVVDSTNSLINFGPSLSSLISKNAAGSFASVIVSNGITHDAVNNTLKLGGNLTGSTTINNNGNTFEIGTFATDRSRFTLSNTIINVSVGGAAAVSMFMQGSAGVRTTAWGYNHSGGGLHSQIRISDTEMVIDDNFNTTGLKYSADYSSNFTSRSLVDQGYVLGAKTYTGSQTLRAGTTSTNTAPLYFQNGSLLTTPANGALEFDGTHLYITIGSNRYQLDQQGGGGGGIDGSGAAGQVTFWQDSDTVTGEAAFAYNASTNILSVDGIQLGISSTSGTTRTVSAVGSEDNIGISISPKANGNVILGVNSTGVVQIGSSSVSGDRAIVTGSSNSNASLSLWAKGAGSILLQPDTTDTALGFSVFGGAVNSALLTVRYDNDGTTAGVFLIADIGDKNGFWEFRETDTEDIITAGGYSTTNKAFVIRGRTAHSSQDGSDVRIESGAASSGNKHGNIVLNTKTSGSTGTRGFLIIEDIPTSSAGLPSGAIWSNNNVLTRVP